MRLASASSAIRAVRFSGTISPLLWRFSATAPAELLRRQFAYIKGADGAMKPFQVELADRLRAGDRFDGELDPAVDQDLSVAGLGAEAGAGIDPRAVRRIGEAPLVTAAAQEGGPREDTATPTT